MIVENGLAYARSHCPDTVVGRSLGVDDRGCLVPSRIGNFLTIDFVAWQGYADRDTCDGGN